MTISEVTGLNNTPLKLRWVSAGLAAALLLAGCGSKAPSAATPLPSAAASNTSLPAASGSDEPASTSPAAVQFAWTAEIVQGGAVLPVADGGVSLARAPFTIRARLAQPVAIKLNVFNTDQNFKVLHTGYIFGPDCQDALCTGMDVAEDRLNPEQDLFIDPQLTHYLYYLAPDDHRWSRADVTDQGAVLERDVAKLNGAPIEENADPALYLLLLANPANEDVIDPGELKTLVLHFQ
ncbi:MAG: hypothetical protein ABI847_10905 [Anaerolineales bacterium]